MTPPPDPALVAAVQRALEQAKRKCLYGDDEHPMSCGGEHPSCPADYSAIAALVASWVGPLLVEHKIVTKMVEINANSWWAYATELAEAHKVALAALPWRRGAR